MNISAPASTLTQAESEHLSDESRSRFAERYLQLEQALHALPDKPEETPNAALRALWHLAAGTALSAAQATERSLPNLNSEQLATLDALITQRLQGMPLAYITGRQRFMHLDLLASPQALIPRRETEMLGLAALARQRELVAMNGRVRIVDVCCGSGNLALALAHADPRAHVHAADLSLDALELARSNTSLLGLAQQVSFHHGDLLSPFDTPDYHGRIDMVISAPPYISTAKVDTLPSEIIGYEPTLAFDGGPFGVGILMRLMRESPALLRAGGWLGMEVGLGQGAAMLQLLRKNFEFDRVDTVCDTDGNIRVLMARRRAPANASVSSCA